ncbi:MAG: glycoside hydrolase family 43 protein [Salinivirgaceae bacterium]|nr:glycoside hydrolase family 43 protein [Salinivirgaceae bacterium]
MSNKTLLIFTVICTLTACTKSIKIPTESDMGAYLMVYHKDADHSLHMALSYDGYKWSALRNDSPIICGDTIATQHGIRDPHIFRGPDGAFYLAMTDLHIFAQSRMANNPHFSKISEYRETQWERDEMYGWGNNHALVLLKSFDLINWSRANIDFINLTSPTGLVDENGNEYKWSDAGCIWAPEIVYDSVAEHIMIHFTVRMHNDMCQIYYAYVNNDFNKLISEPKILFQSPLNEKGMPAYTVIDSDIIKVGDSYHLFVVSHEGAARPKHATSKNITGPYVFDDNYYDGEREIHEAPNCWKRIGEDKWILMYDNYHRRPSNFGFVETSDFISYKPLGYFDEDTCPMSRTNFEAQKHGAVTQITISEAKKLEEYYK